MGLLDRLPDNPRWLRILWALLVVIWTIMLLAPMPGEERWPLSLGPEHRYYLAKTAHVAVFAFLTVLAGCLAGRFSWRLLLLFFLMAHAAATEWAQSVLPFHRTGTVTDVVLDHCGIGVGLLVSWRSWTRRD
jgi:hypothetical protein